MSRDITIRPEAEGDREAIWKVNQQAFASGAESNLVDSLRGGGFVEVSLVAESGGEITGHILFSRVTIQTKAGSVDALSLAPMAVLPQLQRQGIGTRLVDTGLEVCRKRGHSIVVVLGHPDYYRRFGFSADLAEPLANPFGSGDAWMARELAPGVLANVRGSVEYPSPFTSFE